MRSIILFRLNNVPQPNDKEALQCRPSEAADGSAAMEIEQTLVFERCGRLFWYTILAPLPIPIRS